MPDVRDWLLQGDPSVRWRVLQGLDGADDRTVAAERAQVADAGWGARLLAEQSEDGTWGGGLYSPKWVSTTYTLLHLMWLGLPAGHPATHRALERLWDWQSRWRVPETCIESMLIRMTAAFGYPAERLDALVTDLLEQQQDDGGWNCDTRTNRAKHSSFHTSIQALEALDAYRTTGGVVAVDAAHARGVDFFLRHHLYRSHRTGEVAIASSVRFPAFPEWHFDVLRGLEHMAAARMAADDRLTDAVTLLARKRHDDGRWHTYAPYAGRQWFRLEEPGASRWTTVRALSVLAWWQAAGGDDPSRPVP